MPGKAAVRYLADTSVVIPLVLASHDAHVAVMREVGRRRVHLAAHAAIESFSVLTRLPGDARLEAADAVTLLTDRFVGVVAAPPPSFDALGRFAAAGIAGGAVYDALVASSVGERDVLLSRDARAISTYEQLGITVELLG